MQQDDPEEDQPGVVAERTALSERFRDGVSAAGSVGRATSLARAIRSYQLSAISRIQRSATRDPRTALSYSFAFSRSFSSVMNSPMSRKWR